MKKIGLALSGGGFRATLYHLGLIRFLRDADILPQVTHITSVSGGSVTAAHLVLNWGRYTGSVSEFDAAAAELLSFVQLDVRNRIVRRFILGFSVRWLRRLLGLSNRRLTRTGLLESHYEELYGDTSLFELPESPQLHILATNLSEGCLCSFNRSGLLVMRRRRPGTSVRVGWFDWSLLSTHADVYRFVSLLNTRRLLRDVEHEHERVDLQSFLSEAHKAWHGVKLNQPDWGDRSRSIALCAELRREGLYFHIMLNAYWEPLEFELPAVVDGPKWRRWLDTALGTPCDIMAWREAPIVNAGSYCVDGRSVVMLYRTLPAANTDAGHLS